MKNWRNTGKWNCNMIKKPGISITGSNSRSGIFFLPGNWKRCDE